MSNIKEKDGSVDPTQYENSDEMKELLTKLLNGIKTILEEIRDKP